LASSSVNSLTASFAELHVYLGLGLVGLLVSLNKLEIVADKLSITDIFGPFLIATALVIRVIKTRAEIGHWPS
jgi:hypothetical protein